VDPYQTFQGDEDVFVTKLSNDGSSLVYSTYLGGGRAEHGWSVVVDEADHTYVGGWTYSSDFPTNNPYLEHQGGWDAFVVKMAPGCCGQYTGGQTGNSNCDMEGKRNLADITELITRVYLTPEVPLCCEENGNTSGDPEGTLNLTDITRLIDYIYISHAETAACP
jgi:hypothetical protein